MLTPWHSLQSLDRNTPLFVAPIAPVRGATATRTRSLCRWTAVSG